MTQSERVLLLLSLLVVVLFLALALHYTGEIVLPLDDSYIHAQYARSIAEGHPFRFTPGVEASTGLTSLLYPLLLAPLYAVGLRGDALPAAMFILGAALFVLSTLLVHRVARRSGWDEVAWLAAGLYATSGALAWGYLSGMEVGLFCTLWLGLALALQSDSPRRAAALAAALAWVRPEGWLWCWALALGAPQLAGRDSAFRRRPLWRWLPVVVGAVPLLLNLLVGGSVSPASARPKSALYLPELHLPTVLQHAVGFLVTVVKRLLTGVGGPDVSGPLNRLDSWTHAAPLTLLFVLLAIALGLGRKKRDGRRTGDAIAQWATWLCLLLLWVAFTTGSSAHNFRYVLPAWPAIVLLTAAGVGVLGGALGKRGEARRRLRLAFGVYLLAFGALGTVGFALLYGQQSHAFSRQYVDAARWIDENLPADARIASLDVGILGYYSHREIFDLFGLTTPAMGGVTVFFADDEGTKCELMERMPAAERPTHFVLHERRFDHADWNPYIALAPRRSDGRVATLHESRVLLDVPRVGDDLQTWEADWRLAGSGDRPAGPPRRVIDRLDVADPDSERAHGVEIAQREPGFFGRNLYLRLPAPDGREIADGGRGLAGRLETRLGKLTPGREVELRLRTLPTAQDEPFVVAVDGVELGRWELPAETRGWRETAIRLPAAAITRQEVDLSLDGVAMVFHLWALEVGEEVAGDDPPDSPDPALDGS